MGLRPLRDLRDLDRVIPRRVNRRAARRESRAKSPHSAVLKDVLLRRASGLQDCAERGLEAAILIVRLRPFRGPQHAVLFLFDSFESPDVHDAWRITVRTFYRLAIF